MIPFLLPAQDPGVRVTYRATAGTVTETGLYTAPSTPSAAAVIVRGGSSTNTVQITVVGGSTPVAERSEGRPNQPQSTDRPSGASQRVAKNGLWLDEDFSRYNSISEYRSNPYKWLTSDVPGWFHQEQLALDPAEGYGGSKQSLRYDWPGTGRASACASDYAIVTNYAAPPDPEVWIEIVHKFARSFNTNTRNVGGACKFGEYKFLLFWRPSGDRFDLINGKLAREWWSANPESPPFGRPHECVGSNHNCRVAALGSDMHWDGQWHVYRVHIRFNSAQGARDGVLQLWVDGRLVKDVQGVDMTNSTTHKWSNRLKSVMLGSNSNSGTSGPTQTWWGRLRIYTSDPGW